MPFCSRWTSLSCVHESEAWGKRPKERQCGHMRRRMKWPKLLFVVSEHAGSRLHRWASAGRRRHSHSSAATFTDNTDNWTKADTSQPAGGFHYHPDDSDSFRLLCGVRWDPMLPEEKSLMEESTFSQVRKRRRCFFLLPSSECFYPTNLPSWGYRLVHVCHKGLWQRL